MEIFRRSPGALQLIQWKPDPPEMRLARQFRQQLDFADGDPDSAPRRRLGRCRWLRGRRCD
jgi:hypothetical protein